MDDPGLDHNFMGDPEPELPSQAAPPIPDPQKPQEGQMPRGKVAPGPSGNRLEQEREGRGQGALTVACTPHYADEKRCTGPQVLPPGMCLPHPPPHTASRVSLLSSYTVSAASLLQQVVPSRPGTPRMGAVLPT